MSQKYQEQRLKSGNDSGPEQERPILRVCNRVNYQEKNEISEPVLSTRTELWRFWSIWVLIGIGVLIKLKWNCIPKQKSDSVYSNESIPWLLSSAWLTVEGTVTQCYYWCNSGVPFIYFQLLCLQRKSRALLCSGKEKGAKVNKEIKVEKLLTQDSTEEGREYSLGKNHKSQPKLSTITLFLFYLINFSFLFIFNCISMRQTTTKCFIFGFQMFSGPLPTNIPSYLSAHSHPVSGASVYFYIYFIIILCFGPYLAMLKSYSWPCTQGSWWCLGIIWGVDN